MDPLSISEMSVEAAARQLAETTREKSAAPTWLEELQTRGRNGLDAVTSGFASLSPEAKMMLGTTAAGAGLGLGSSMLSSRKRRHPLRSMFTGGLMGAGLGYGVNLLSHGASEPATAAQTRQKITDLSEFEGAAKALHDAKNRSLLSSYAPTAFPTITARGYGAYVVGRKLLDSTAERSLSNVFDEELFRQGLSSSASHFSELGTPAGDLKSRLAAYLATGGIETDKAVKALGSGKITRLGWDNLDQLLPNWVDSREQAYFQEQLPRLLDTDPRLSPLKLNPDSSNVAWLQRYVQKRYPDILDRLRDDIPQPELSLNEIRDTIARGAKKQFENQKIEPHTPFSRSLRSYLGDASEKLQERFRPFSTDPRKTKLRWVPSRPPGAHWKRWTIPGLLAISGGLAESAVRGHRQREHSLQEQLRRANAAYSRDPQGMQEALQRGGLGNEELQRVLQRIRQK